MADTPWAATITADDGWVRLRFTTPQRDIGLTPDGARHFAATLLLLAETAESAQVIDQLSTVESFAPRTGDEKPDSAVPLLQTRENREGDRPISEVPHVGP